MTLAAGAAQALAGAEVLLRWHHPERGSVSPACFIPVAEASGLIVPLGELVLRRACAQIRAWLDRYGSAPRLAVNVSAQQFAQPGLPRRIEAVMAEFRVPVSIDDFGTGYSSLAYLRRFTVDAIKIDKSFVDDIGTDRHAEMICDAILRLGHPLGTRVIAEGVEREEQAAFLRRRRCDEAQGFLFGRPLSPAEFEAAWLSRRAAA
ncbi:MAG: EAL domain-containing protein [Betaproteobacteria bacterium]